MLYRPIEDFRDALLSAMPDARIAVEQPRGKPGEWWLTVRFPAFEALLSWTPSRGWGLHGDMGFDAPPWSLYADVVVLVDELRGAAAAHR